MGIIKTWVEINEEVGSAVGGAIADTARGVANAACTVMGKYPNAYPISPYSRGFLSAICEDASAPIPEPPETFQGGQCEGVEYRVIIEYTRGTGGPVADRGANVYGPVAGGVSNFNASLNRYDIGVSAYTAPPASNPFVFVVDASSATAGAPDYVRVTSVTRLDGQPDDCGDPPGGYPPDPPIDINDFSQEIEVNTYNEAGDIVTTENYDIDLSDIALGDFDFSVSVGGTTVDIDIGGVSIGGGQPGTGLKTRREVENIEPPGSGGNSGFNPEEYVTEDLPEEELEKEEIERLAWVAVSIVQLQTKGKTILQKSEADNDYFAGYLCFTVQTDDGLFQLPPEPVRKASSIFKAPIGATGFRAYSVNGATLKAIVYREKVEVEA